jgi:hypothetical protein
MRIFKPERSRRSRWGLLMIGVAATVLAILLVAFIVGAGASGPGAKRWSTLPRSAPEDAALLELLPELKGIGASVPGAGPGSRVHPGPTPGCRAFIPGTDRSRPIPTHFGAGPLLVGSPGPGERVRPRRPDHSTPRSRCVSATGG